MEDRNYASITREIIHGQESVIKTVFIKIFIDLYKSLRDTCEIETQDLNYYDDFIYFPDDLDLIDATKLFRARIFKNKKLSEFYRGYGSKFSIKNINGIINTIRMPQRNIKKNIIDSIELKHPYRFSLSSMEEIGRIADEITHIRHMVSHNNNIKQSSQALILLGNVSRLLGMAPDSVSNTTNGFNELNEYVKVNYFNSIVSVYRPDLEEQKQNDNEVDGQIHEALLTEKVDAISLKLEELNEIKLALQTNQKLTESINESVNNFQTHEVSKNTDEDFQDILKPSPDPDLNFQDEDEVDPKVINITSFETDTQKIKTEYNPDDLEVDFDSYEKALTAGIVPKDVANWAISDMKQGYSLSREDLKVVEMFVQNGSILKGIYEEYLEMENEDIGHSITKSELYDCLMMIRNDIKEYMTKEHEGFENWHNILMTLLAHEIVNENIKSIDEFRKNKVFQKYYNSEQMPRSLRDQPGHEEKLEFAKNIMNIQLDKYWNTIQNHVDAYHR